MGSSVIASCACGYRSPTLMIGGGMHSFTTLCAFPAHCAAGEHLVTVNLFDAPRRCPDGHAGEPTPYSDGSLIEAIGPRVVASWRFRQEQLVLTDGRYFCPACHTFGLTFARGDIMWD